MDYCQLQGDSDCQHLYRPAGTDPVDALPGKVFHGKVTAISEATGSKYSLVPTDNSAGNFVKVQQRIPVRIDLEGVSEEEMGSLRAGMMVITEALRK